MFMQFTGQDRAMASVEARRRRVQAYHRQSSDASVHTESACREKG